MARGTTRRSLLACLGAWLGLGAPGALAAPSKRSPSGSERSPSGWERSPERDPHGGGSPTSAEPLDVPLDDLDPGRVLTVEWHGKPVFVRRRTEAEIDRERAVPLTELRDPEPDQARAKRPEWVVVEGICTHGGCIPHGPLGDYDGWYCFCHGSQFDTAGRVRSGPARENLAIPPYEFLSARAIRIGP